MRRALTALLGNSQRLDGGAMFGNAPKALWSRWLPADEHNRVPLACRALLIHEAHESPTSTPEIGATPAAGRGRYVLLETGIGAFFEPKLKDRYGVMESEHVLLQSLQQHGLSHTDIDVIVLSHLHFDHAGGLLAPYAAGAPPRLLFPRARFIVSHDAWARACAPHPRDRASFIPELTDLLAATDRLEIVQGDTSPTLGDGYRFHLSHGHTPGLLLTEVQMPEGPLLFAGDLIPGVPWIHVPITMGYDRYPELLVQEKAALLDDLVARRGCLFFTHDPQTALCRVERDERGRYHAGAKMEDGHVVSLRQLP